MTASRAPRASFCMGILRAGCLAALFHAANAGMPPTAKRRTGGAGPDPEIGSTGRLGSPELQKPGAFSS